MPCWQDKNLIREKSRITLNEIERTSSCDIPGETKPLPLFDPCLCRKNSPRSFDRFGESVGEGLGTATRV